MDEQRIQILDEATVNKIAAGEVIERPASVVKELIDNSIDAGASEVRVEIKGGGAKLVSVIDNGCGMSRIDTSIAFKKHATSKIRSIEDLEDASTLGFRGEALSSIASVAKVEIITRQKDDISGIKAMVVDGEVEGVSDVGGSVGTTVHVHELFYNTPARRKYLKSERTEIAHITDVVTRHSLGNPDISFTLMSNGKVIVRSPASGELFDTMVHIFGSDVAKSMIPVSFESELVRVSGYISKPELTRSTGDLQNFFINGRWVSSKPISNALRLGYYMLIPKGRYPAAVLKIHVNPHEVDVNVHPTKSQVRLSHEQEVMDAVISAVEEALEQNRLVHEIKAVEKTPTIQSVLEPVPEPEIKEIVREVQETYTPSVKDTERRLKRTQRTSASIQPSRKGEVSGLDGVRIMGQVDNVYIVAELEGKLVLIDQHAAHERILYEQVRDKASMGWQELITPVTLEFSPKEKVLLEEYLPRLEEMGFAISEFGPNTYVVTTVPSMFGQLESHELVHDIISEIISAGRIKDDTGIYEHICKTMACRGAIKAGAMCTMEQMEDLVRQLQKAQNPYSCPHGRPTMISFSRAELDRMFKRTG